MTNQIRQLVPGDTIPTSEPRRYRAASGYVRLRWKVGPYSYVEGYEHRVVMGLPGGDVHHKNGIKDDNRRENLEVLPAPLHQSRHHKRGEWLPTAVQMYRAGASTIEIASAVGLKDAGTVSRALRTTNITMRDGGCGRRKDVDTDRVKALHLAGWSAPSVAAAIGSTAHVVRRVLRDLGISAHRQGAPNRHGLMSVKVA